MSAHCGLFHSSCRQSMFIYYLFMQKSTVRDGFFSGWISMFAVEYFRWTLSSVVKNCLLPILFGKVFSKPIFSIRFCLCGKTAVCWHTNSYSMVFNQRAQLNFNGKQFFSKVQKLVHEHKHIDTRYWRQKKTKYITFTAATKTKPHTKNCAIRTKQMFCSTFFNGMKI